MQSLIWTVIAKDFNALIVQELIGEFEQLHREPAKKHGERYAQDKDEHTCSSSDMHSPEVAAVCDGDGNRRAD